MEMQNRMTRAEELLGRAPLFPAQEIPTDTFCGRRVLVTGGGGSIGQELCRRIVGCRPEALIILDIYENNAYDIEQELRRKYGASLSLTVVIASIRDSDRIEEVFQKYRPEIILHAAAHKHVPLMENNPAEAIKTTSLAQRTCLMPPKNVEHKSVFSSPPIKPSTPRV